jgi:hypothetical protein
MNSLFDRFGSVVEDPAVKPQDDEKIKIQANSNDGSYLWSEAF